MKPSLPALLPTIPTRETGPKKIGQSTKRENESRSAASGRCGVIAPQCRMGIKMAGNKKTPRRAKTLRGTVLALSIFPGRCQPSIVDRNELNYRVRNGNGWTLILISTNSMSSGTARKQTILYCLAFCLSSTRLNFKHRV